MTETVDARIAAEFAAGADVADICARYNVSGAYVVRVVTDATVARKRPKKGLAVTGNRVALSMLIAWISSIVLHSILTGVLVGLLTYVLVTALTSLLLTALRRHQAGMLPNR